MSDQVHTVTFLTEDDMKACESAHKQARIGNLIPRNEWEALGVRDQEHGSRVAQISNALRHRLWFGPLPIPLEWLQEFNELAQAQTK